MTLDELKKQWKEDCEIDDIELDNASLEVPKLHAKYSELLTDSIVALKGTQLEYKLLLKDKWIADYLMSNSCSHCGESELICLQFYPDDRKIRALSKRSEDKTEVLEYISNNEIVCRNCFQKRDSDIITS